VANPSTGQRDTGGNNTPDRRREEEQKTQAQPRTGPAPDDTGPTSGRNDTDMTSSSLRRQGR